MCVCMFDVTFQPQADGAYVIRNLLMYVATPYARNARGPVETPLMTLSLTKKKFFLSNFDQISSIITKLDSDFLSIKFLNLFLESLWKKFYQTFSCTHEIILIKYKSKINRQNF